MKKFLTLLISVVVIGVNFVLPETSFAQAGNNTFNCKYEPGFGCVSGSNSCLGGFKTDDNKCSTISDMSICQGTVNLSCVPTTQNQRYKCVPSFGGCQADPNGPYTSITACQSSCSGSTTTKFKCSKNQCVEDQNGTYNTADCNGDCRSSVGPECFSNGSRGISTAIGCLSVLSEDGPETFLSQLLGWSIGVGGGIAFLLIVYASFMIMTSAGSPDRLKAGQELLTSAISGLILLIFSIFVLKFIGVDILGLDSFGFGNK